MGNPRGVKRDFEALEDRRLKAATLLKKGWSQADVAREVGVHRQSVSRWAAALESDGTRGLRATGGRGRKARLTAAQLIQIEKALERGPEALGYETGLWTLARIAELIEQKCGVHYHPGHIWKILRRLKWSVQRPVGRALERDEENIEHWKKVRWPKVKKRCPARTNHRLHR
jgi:transposase